MNPDLQPQTPFPPNAAPETSAQKQSTNCTNSTNSPISEIREISGCSQKTIGEIREISGPAPKISVIVPVYKVEKYLPECIESVLAQTFTDFELILVDDGSPDNSGAICDAYAARDPRIRVFHKENGGVSSARNLGLDHARGEWIMFIDGDDAVSPEIIEILLELKKRHKADIPLCSWAQMTEEGVVSPRKKCKLRGTETVGRVEAMYRVQDGRYYEGSPCCRLFSNEKIKQKKLRFDEKISIGEDWLFSTEYFAKCVHSAVSISEPLYFYRVRKESAMHSGNEKMWSVLHAQRKIRELLQRIYPENLRLNAAHNIREGMNFFVLSHFFIERSADRRLKFLLKNLRKRVIFVIISDRLSLFAKCSILLASFSFPVWKKTYRVFKNRRAKG